jgi:hypothetical protein
LAASARLLDPDATAIADGGGLAATFLPDRGRRADEGAQSGRSTARIFTIFEGTSEIQRMIIGRSITGLNVR